MLRVTVKKYKKVPVLESIAVRLVQNLANVVQSGYYGCSTIARTGHYISLLMSLSSLFNA